MDIRKVFGAVSQFAVPGDMNTTQLGNIAAGLESDALGAQTLDTTKDEILSGLEGLELSESQRAAGKYAVGVGMNPNAAFGGQSAGGTMDVSPMALGVKDTAVKVGNESFDGRDIAAAVRYTVTGAIANAKLDAASEALFPTLTVDPAKSGVLVETETVKVYREFTRSQLTANADQFKEVSLIKAMSNPSILGNYDNELTPVFRAGTNDNLFLAGLGHNVTVDGNTVATAPLKAGETIPLIGVSQTDAALSRRKANDTDALEAGVEITKLHVTTGGDTLPLDLSPLSVAFTPTYDGHNKDIVLAFSSKILTIPVGPNTPVSVTGTASAVLAALPANYTVVLDVAITGTGNVQSGDIAVYGNTIKVLEVRNAAGKAVDLTAGDGKTIKDALADLKIEGYEVNAKLTNSNVADLGLIGTVEVYGKNYVIPARPGLTIKRPLVNPADKDNDYGRLLDRINISIIRSKVAAYERISNFFNAARNILSSGGDMSGFTSVLPASAYVDTHINDITIDLAATLDSRRSGERYEDIAGVVQGKIADMVDRMLTESNYMVAHSITNQGEPIVINVVGSARAVRYVKNLELGPNFKVNVAAWTVNGAGDEIYVVPGTINPIKGSKADILNFGFRGYVPTAYADLNRSNNDNIGILFNQPRFLHVIQVPVGLRVTVAGIDASIDNKITVNHHVIP